MVQGYYTLQEAAQVLGMKVDDLKALAQRNQIRSFQDRGTLRFRIQDIQELQRQRLGDSDPEMVLGESVSPKPAPVGAPKSGSLKTPRPSPSRPVETFDFELDESVEIGKEPLSLEGSAVRSKSGIRTSAPKSSGPRTPKHGSDSDVKLVADGSDSFTIRLGDGTQPDANDSDVRLGELGSGKKSGLSSRRSGSSRGRSQSPADSGVRLVPMDDDAGAAPADAPAASESDVRLGARSSPSHRASDNMSQTEEIDLDEEIKKRAENPDKPDTIFKINPSKIGKPGATFELSENDLDASPTRATDEAPRPAPKPPKSAPPKSPKPKKKKETEFDIVPSDEDFSLDLDDESLDLGADAGDDFEGPKSGINLSRPSDKGISLESPKADEHVDFELDLDSPATPKPKSKRKPVEDDSSEFDLALDDSALAADDSDDSEFELSLDDSALAGDDEADSDFELAAGEVDEAAPKTPSRGKSKSKSRAADTEERDLFETDIDLPADDSSDDTVDADSSDFEIALDDSDISVEDESGSQVVALDEDDYADTGETIDGDIGDYEEYDDGDIEEEEPEVRERVVVQEVLRDRWVRPAPWGVLPVVFMTPCLIVLVIAGIMGWELVQSSSGFKTSGVLTRNIGEMMNLKMK